MLYFCCRHGLWSDDQQTGIEDDINRNCGLEQAEDEQLTCSGFVVLAPGRCFSEQPYQFVPVWSGADLRTIQLLLGQPEHHVSLSAHRQGLRQASLHTQVLI